METLKYILGGFLINLNSAGNIAKEEKHVIEPYIQQEHIFMKICIYIGITYTFTYVLKNMCDIMNMCENLNELKPS